jgi:hypothetical protein
MVEIQHGEALNMGCSVVSSYVVPHIIIGVFLEIDSF